MNTFIPFLQINLFLLVFFGFYWIVLRKETFYQLNRLYLWATVVFSILLPFIQIETVKSWFVTERIQEVVYNATLLDSFLVSVPKTQTIDWFEIIKNGYLLVVAILFIRLIINIYKAYSATKSTEFLENNAFSFFGSVSVDSSLIESETIEYHEEIHSKQMHYLDLFLFEILCIVLWINPLVYVLKKQISMLHEYIADFHASQVSNSKTDYATLLFCHQFKSTPDHLFVQSFYKPSTLKLRVMMLFKKPSESYAILKYTIVLPIFISLTVISSLTWAKKSEILKIVRPVSEKVISFSKAEIQVSSEPFDNEYLKIETDTLINPKNEIKDVVFSAVSQNPEFPGGIKEMYKFLGNSIVYPKAAQFARVQGRVFVKFIVEKDGSIDEVEILKGIGFGCDEEAKRVIRLMPKWNPGYQNGKPERVYYNMPIVFKFENASGEKLGNTTDLDEIVVVGYGAKSSHIVSENEVREFVGIGLNNKGLSNNQKITESKIKSNIDEALIFINGIEIEDKKISDLDANNIENVQVIKGEEAIKKYGDRAKKGVILIETKKN